MWNKNSKNIEEIIDNIAHLHHRIDTVEKKLLKSKDLDILGDRLIKELLVNNHPLLDWTINSRIEGYFANTSIVKEVVKNKPLFLIGSGPSLKGVDLSVLKNCYTMSFNRSYIAFSDWGFEPTYFAGIDLVVNEDNVNEFKELIAKSKINRFFFNRSEFNIDNYSSARTTLVQLGANTNPNLDFSKPLRTSNTGLFGLQVALGVLGFKEVYLLGCDANYKEEVKDVDVEGHEYISKEDSDPNHFRSDYFGKGKRYNKPDANLYHLPAWKAFFEQNILNNTQGYKVYNCAKEGKLTFFEYKDFNQISKDIKKYEK